MPLTRPQVERLLFGVGRATRFTQDSPVLPDVWIGYGMWPDSRQDLLLTPHREYPAGEVAARLRERLARERDGGPGDAEPAGVVYNQSTVGARLTLRELVRVVLPMTKWWQTYVWKPFAAAGEGTQGPAKAGSAVSPSDVLGRDEVRELLIRGIAEPIEGLSVTADGTDGRASPDLVWMVRIVGTLALAEAAGQEETDAHLEELYAGTDEDPEEPSHYDPEAYGRRIEAAERAIHFLRPLLESFDNPRDSERERVWSVNRNRPARTTLWHSVLATKADAARRLFELSCDGLAWAVIDSGIDATHPAFARRTLDPETGRRVLPAPPCDPAKSRIVKTYDFTLIRYLLDPSGAELEARIRELEQVAERIGDRAEAGAVGAELEALRRLREALSEKGRSRRARRAKELKRSLRSGREIDWAFMAEYLEVPHDQDYVEPRDPHGTHVAGILAGDWRHQDDRARVREGHDLVGVCPDLELYDLRVLDHRGRGSEFSVIAALQLVRHLNSNKDHTVVHGANLSLSINHEVVNYACGCTPVCEEAERLVGSGSVVVAAAGNRGYLRFLTVSGAGRQMTEEGYHSISITDPGNAASVITVGATHRQRPHSYGVSYFSSRGPTGDGRIKPDLVAPGEKINAPVPGPEVLSLDGTSMAAPHVSGAAALLMARHRELGGEPQRIKEILTATATDLGRERYFQGAGMVDVLRALQSI